MLQNFPFFAAPYQKPCLRFLCLLSKNVTRHRTLTLWPHTAISRRVVGNKCARDNPERKYGIWSIHCSWLLYLSNLLLLLFFNTYKHMSMTSCTIVSNFFFLPSWSSGQYHCTFKFKAKRVCWAEYSQLLPCAHPAITDTLIIWTAAKSQAKINYRCLSEIP